MADFISVAEAAAILDKTPKTVRLWATENRISARRVGSQWRILKTAVYEMIGGGAKTSTDERSDLPHGHVVGNRWIQDHRPIFQAFVFDQLDQFNPDHVVLVDRKGRLYDTLRLIPANLTDKLIYPSALRWMKEPSILKGRRVAVLEESTQRGSNLKRLRSELEELGAEVLTLALLRRRSLFESGLALDPKTVACLDLSDADFARATAEVSSVLQSDVICLDVDHFPAGEFQVKGSPSFEVMATALGELGSLMILPAPDPAMKVWCFTVDNPRFFDWDKLGLPNSFTREGVVKLRIYYDYRRNPGSLFVVPVIYPRASLTTDDIERVAHAPDESWSRYVVRPDGWDRFDKVAKAELLYRSFIIFCSFQLMLQTMPFLHSLATELGLELNNNALQVSDQGLSRTFGQLETTLLSDLVRSDLLSTWQQIIRSSWWPPIPEAPAIADSEALRFDPYDDSGDIDALLNVFATFPRSDDPHAGLSRTELLEELRWEPARLSRAFDFALDRGLLKPLIEIRVLGDIYSCIRSYRSTEWGGYFKGSEAHTPARRAAKRLSFIVPYVLDRLMAKGGKLKNGVNDMLRDKVFTNLLHDWDGTGFDRLYLGWEPHYFGPMPVVPEINRPSGGFQSIGQFSIAQGVCELVPNPADKNKSRKLLVPKSNGAWRERISSLNAIERDFLDGLIDTYHDIYVSFDESGDQLVTLAACCDRQVTYICAYQDMVLWMEAMDLVLDQMDLNINSNDPDLLTKHLEDAAKARAQVEEKLDRYQKLGQAKAILQDRLSTSTRPAIADHVLSRLKLGEISDDVPYPLGRLAKFVPLMASINALVHFVAFRYGMAVEKRAQSHRERNAGFYVDRLVKTFPELVSQDLTDTMSGVDQGIRSKAAVDSLRGLYRRAVSLITRHVDDPRDYSDRDVPGDAKLRNVLEAAATLGDRSDTGILFTDISRFVHTALLMSEINNTSRDDAARELRDKVKGEMGRLMDVLGLSPQMRPVGGDGWVIADDNVEALLDLACRLNRSSSLRGQPFKSAITFGPPGVIQDGPVIGSGFIRAYYLTEKSGMAEGGIRVSGEAAEKVKSAGLANLLVRVEEAVDLKSFGQHVVHDVDWLRYGDTDK